MRITYLHQYFNTPAMSGGTRSYEMARRLVAMGHEVNMITTWREPDGRKGWFETEEAGIHVHWLPVPYSNHMGYGDRIKAFAYFALKAARKASSFPADIVFATSTPLTIAIPGVFASRRQGVPMVFEVRDLWPEVPIAIGALRNPVVRYLARSLEKFAYKNSKHIVALSSGMRDGIVMSGYPLDRISVIPNSADIELFSNYDEGGAVFRNAHPELEDSPLVVYAGTIGHINGVDYLPKIAAASLNRGSCIKFVVVGGGACELAVRDTANGLGVMGKNFFMYPPVMKKMMPTVLSAAKLSISLFVDIKEMQANSANKFFDSLASGTPLVINYGGWQADVLGESGAGIVIPPDNPESAAVLIENFLADPERFGASGKAAMRLAKERFSRDVLANQLADVLIHNA